MGGVLGRGLCRARCQRGVHALGQMAATEPGAFYGAVVQPVAAQAQACLRLPPAVHIQRRCGVGIQPAVGRGLHAGRIGATQLGKRLQQGGGDGGGSVVYVRLAPGVAGVQQPGFGAVAPGFAAVARDPAQGVVLDKTTIHGQGHRLRAAHHDRPAGAQGGAACQGGSLGGDRLQQGRGLGGRHGQQHGLVVLRFGAVLGAVQLPASACRGLQRLHGGLPLEARGQGQLLHVAHQMRGGRGHARGADKALQRAVVQHKVLAIVRADAALPQRGCAGVLPLGHLGAKVRIPRGEVLCAVVALPLGAGIAAAARAHAPRRATAFVEHVYVVARLGQKLRTRQPGQARAHDGNRQACCGEGRGCGHGGLLGQREEWVLRHCRTRGLSADSGSVAVMPSSGLWYSAGQEPPTHSAIREGSCARSSRRLASTTVPFCAAEKLSSTTSTRCAWAACTTSSKGVWVPRDTQVQPSSTSIASTISRPRPCSSCGKVVSSTLGPKAGGEPCSGASEAIAWRSTPVMTSVYRCSSKISNRPCTHASPTATVSGATSSVMNGPRPMRICAWCRAWRSPWGSWAAIVSSRADSSAEWEGWGTLFVLDNFALLAWLCWVRSWVSSATSSPTTLLGRRPASSRRRTSCSRCTCSAG